MERITEADYCPQTGDRPDALPRWQYPPESVPAWRLLTEADHRDGMGGCWSILHGEVARTGGRCCDTCEYRRAAEAPCPS